jgi:hypothetical protein
MESVMAFEFPNFFGSSPSMVTQRPNSIMDFGAQPINALMDPSGRQDISWGGMPGPNGAGAPGSGFGWNLGTAQLGMAGLGAIGNIWNAFQANNLAREQLGLTRRIADTNLTNQIKSYNTALTDRIGARAKVNGMSEAEERDYIARNQLTR